MKTYSVLLIIAAILWIIWGVVHTFAGQQVWQVHERSAAPELIFTTSSLLP